MPTDWSAIVTAVATVIYTIGTFLLWRSTQKSVTLLGRQISKDVAVSRSNAYHSIIDAHRELWLSLIANPHLASLFGLSDNELARRRIVGSLLINHCSRIFIDFETGVLDNSEVDSFARDAVEMFSISFVRERWEEVRRFHKSGFIDFVDSKVLPGCRTDIVTGSAYPVQTSHSDS